MNGAWAPYDPRANADPQNSGTAWGSEAEFAYQLSREFPGRRLFIVKEAVNGQFLAANSGGDWWPDNANERFAGLEGKVGAARALLAAAGIGECDEVVARNQGEADVADLSTSTSYGANLTYFLQKFRQRVSARALFVAERIRPELGGDAAPHHARNFLVRKGTLDAAAADGNGTVVDTDFEPGDFGTLHPGSSRAEGCGLRVYRAWRGTYAAIHGSTLNDRPSFAFAPQTEVGMSSPVVSETVRPTAFERDAAVSIANGEYRILHPGTDVDSGSNVASDWTASPGRIHKWQSVQLRTTAASGPSSERNVVLTLGGVSSAWSVTTAASATSYQPETDAFVARALALGGGSFGGTQSKALDEFFVTAKSSTWWAKIVSLRARFADAIASGINLRDQATQHALVFTTSPMSWTRELGWFATDSNQARDLKVNPSVELPQNNASLIL